MVTALEFRLYPVPETGGAAPGHDAGPIGPRATRLSVIADSRTPALADALRPYSSGGAFLNFLHDPVGPPTPTAAAPTIG